MSMTSGVRGFLVSFFLIHSISRHSPLDNAILSHESFSISLFVHSSVMIVWMDWPDRSCFGAEWAPPNVRLERAGPMTTSSFSHLHQSPSHFNNKG